MAPETASAYLDGLRLRSDSREEVADTHEADEAYGCLRDAWCILRSGHEGSCCDDREVAP
jgi:hypothetical protein